MKEANEKQLPPSPQQALLIDILGWSKDRPVWIRDALRLLASQSAHLSPADILRLTSICKAESGIPSDDIRPEMFSEKHIPTHQHPKETISLLGISEIRGVNALAEKANLEFNPVGINLIYGDNGAGKTSYTRILKQNCRCASPSPIQSNVYEPPTPKQAKISYSVNGTKSEFLWSEDAACPPDLGAIRIFDSRCADVYVTKEREASFTPYGLSILASLGDNICPQVKGNLVREKDGLIKQLPDLSPLLPDQHARNFITKLDAKTKPQEIEAWTQFTQEDSNELDSIKKVLSVTNPKTRIVALQAQISRIDLLIKAISQIERYYSDQGIDLLYKLVTDQYNTRQAATLAINAAFENTPVKGTGTQGWRELWESARKFVQSEAYPESLFPNTERCPLCQQEIIPETLQLMNRFEAFIKGDVEAHAQRAQNAINSYWAELNNTSLDITHHAPLLKELGDEISKPIEAFFSSAILLKSTLPSIIENNNWSQRTRLSPSQQNQLIEIIKTINTEIENLTKLTTPEQQATQQQRAHHLSSRQTLNMNRDAIVSEVQRLSLLHKYDKAIASCNPSSISKKSGALAEEYVTPELQSAFMRRLGQLFGERCFVEIEKTRTSSGITYFKLKLAKAIKSIPIVEIASEGEFRAIALAAFLAEVDLSQDSNGIVFDDPVSSLDHRFRERFASILRDISHSRQIIIFTHDIFFLSCITYWGSRANPKITPNCIELVSIYEKHGYPQKGVPVEVKSFKDRRKYILDELKIADGYFKEGRTRDCTRIAQSLIPEMRKVTERAVEEILFNGAVKRFDPAVHTTALHPRLTTIIQDDINLIVELMDRYSVSSHDQAPDRKPTLPDIGIIGSDIEKLQTWVTDFNKRA